MLKKTYCGSAIHQGDNSKDFSLFRSFSVALTHKNWLHWKRMKQVVVYQFFFNSCDRFFCSYLQVFHIVSISACIQYILVFHIIWHFPKWYFLPSRIPYPVISISVPVSYHLVIRIIRQPDSSRIRHLLAVSSSKARILHPLFSIL